MLVKQIHKDKVVENKRERIRDEGILNNKK